MLYGIGCDLCRTERVEKILNSAHGRQFARRVFGPEEQVILGFTANMPIAHRAAESAAANFAAKEAFLKAAGTGLSGFALCEIEAVRQKSGAPVYRLTGRAAAWVAENGLCASLSLSHDGGLAMAFCVLEKIEQPGRGV